MGTGYPTQGLITGRGDNYHPRSLLSRALLSSPGVTLISPRFSHPRLLIYCLFLDCPLYTDSFALFPLGVSFPTHLISPVLPSCLSLPFPNSYTFFFFFFRFTPTHSFFHPAIVLFSSLSKQAKLFLSVVHIHCRGKKKKIPSCLQRPKRQGNGNPVWKP